MTNMHEEHTYMFDEISTFRVNNQIDVTMGVYKLGAFSFSLKVWEKRGDFKTVPTFYSNLFFATEDKLVEIDKYATDDQAKEIIKDLEDVKGYVSVIYNSVKEGVKSFYDDHKEEFMTKAAKYFGMERSFMPVDCNILQSQYMSNDSNRQALQNDILKKFNRLMVEAIEENDVINEAVKKSYELTSNIKYRLSEAIKSLEDLSLS